MSEHARGSLRAAVRQHMQGLDESGLGEIALGR